MVSKGRKRDMDLRRKAPTRSPKRRILIVCEGRKTEHLYFRELQHDVHNPRVHVEVSKETGVPLTVVQNAVRLQQEADTDAARLRDENLKWDDVWAVFDVDEHPHIPEASAMASAHSIHLAVSNPCFELWALLHFCEQRGRIGRHDAQSRLREFMADYEKTLDYARMRNGYSQAVKRAVELERIARCTDCPGDNPTTGVYRLTEQIRTSK